MGKLRKLKTAPKGDPTPADSGHVEILGSGLTKSTIFQMKPETCLL